MTHPRPVPVLDGGQQQVAGHERGPLLVLGGPGTGKTTALVELVARRVATGLDPARVLLLAGSRRAASDLRDRVAARVGRTIREPLARTAHAYAFGLLRADAVRQGLPTPRLLTGPEQELIVSELLPSHAHRWPEAVRPALGTRAFARHLRDLLLRVTQHGLAPADLADLGRRHDRPLWVASADFAAEYAGVTALAHPSAYDPAELVRAAVDLLRSDPHVRQAEQARRALVVVDEFSEADPPLVDLLLELAGGGRDLVVAGDPDTAVFGFRGADPAVLASFPTAFPAADGGPAPCVVLTHNHRLPGAVLAAAARVSLRLGGTGAQRVSQPRPEQGEARVRVLAAPSDEVVQIAAHLRRRHLEQHVPWVDMAVICRSAADLSSLRRSLARHDVPVQQRPDEVALWQQAPVRALLDLLAVLSGRDAATPQRLVDLLHGPFGRVDPVRLVGIRRRLVQVERAAGGARPFEQLLTAALLDQTGAAAAAAVDGADVDDLQPLRQVLAAGRASLDGESVEQVLWAMWDASGLAEPWRRAALDPSPAAGLDAAAANRDLDAVLGLFEAAARFTDRLPGAGPAAFLDHVRAQEVPAAAPVDPPGSVERDAVSVLTAHAAKDREWDTVVVARVQEDLWPDLRRRDTLLQTGGLVELLTQGRPASPPEQASAVLAAERRLFYLAITRARSSLLVTAVADGETRPSRFVDDLDPQPVEDRAIELPERVLSLRHVVAELRASVCDPRADPVDRDLAARLLARLAEEHVPGADPDQWYGLAPVSDARPLHERGVPAHLSPSQVEGYLRCPLRWMLQRAGGDPPSALRQDVGTLVHRLAYEAAVGAVRVAGLPARLDELWTEVDAGQGWVARRERARVEAMVSRLQSWLVTNPRPLLGAEVELEVTVGDTVVRGRADRLEQAEHGVVVVDLKTGASPVRGADLAGHPQLGVYQWMVAQGAAGPAAPGQPSGAVLVQLGASRGEQAREQWQESLAASDDPAWPLALVEQVRAGTAAATFPALPGSGCPACPVRTSCPAQVHGRRVTP